MEKSWLRGKCAQVRDCCFIKGGVGGLPAKVTLIRDLREGRESYGYLEEEGSGKREQLMQSPQGVKVLGGFQNTAKRLVWLEKK